MIVTNEQERARKVDAAFIAKSFLLDYPNCFQLLGPDVVIALVDGFLFRRVVRSLEQGQRQDPVVLRMMAADVFNAANHLSSVADKVHQHCGQICWTCDTLSPAGSGH